MDANLLIEEALPILPRLGCRLLTCFVAALTHELVKLLLVLRVLQTAIETVSLLLGIQLLTQDDLGFDGLRERGAADW